MNTNFRWILVAAVAVFLAVMSLYFFSDVAQADGPWYVAQGGSDTNSCLSPSEPCATINGAISKASSVALIYVSEGRYTDDEDYVASINKSTNLSGGWDVGFLTQTGYSIIDGENARIGVGVNGSIGATITNFIIENGSPGFYGSAGGISNSGNLTIANSVIRNNQGFGLINNYSNVAVNLTVNNSQIVGNKGGGVHNANYAILTINNSTIAENLDTGVYNEGTLVLTNSTISGNLSNSGAGILAGSGSTTDIYNSTIAKNTAFIQAGGILYPQYSWGSISLTNTIVAENSAPDGPDCVGDITSNGYNLIGNRSGCDFMVSGGDITNTSPQLGQLIGPANSPKYLTLLETSPAVDAGDPTGCKDHQDILLIDDQRNATRVGRCDIGAYEYTPPGAAADLVIVSGTSQRTPPGMPFRHPFKIGVLDSAGSPVAGVTVDLLAPGSGVSGSFTDTGTNEAAIVSGADGVAMAAEFTANQFAGDYSIVASTTGLVSVDFELENLGWYVRNGGNDINDCQTPGTACASINSVFDKQGFKAGDTVLVGAGIFTDDTDSVISINQDVDLIGGWSENFNTILGRSIIDGEFSRKGTSISQGIVSLSNVVIENGRAEFSCYGQCGCSGLCGSGIVELNDSIIRNNEAFDVGGGIYFEEGRITINRSVIERNKAMEAGGIFIQSGLAVINNSMVSQNEAQSGGGLVNEGATIVVNNSTFTGNRATNVHAGYGGAIYNTGGWGKVFLNNATLYDNSAAYQGGGIAARNNLSTYLNNTIIAGNHSPMGPNCSGMVMSLGYSLISDSTGCEFDSGEGDLINQDPDLSGLIGFEGKPKYFPVQTTSPAINAGDPLGCKDPYGNLLTTDQRGAPRAGHCDIGAYEYTQPGEAVYTSAVNGTPQSAPPGREFPYPLIAAALDEIGTPVGGVVVIFTAPSSGASGIFNQTGSTTSNAVTDINGVTQPLNFTANDISGSYLVTASISGTAPTASYFLKNGGWFVARLGDDNNNCASSTSPCATINGVLVKDEFNSGDSILITAQTYSGLFGEGDNILFLTEDVFLWGGWDRDFVLQTDRTIFECSSDYLADDRFLQVTSGVKVTIDRFIIQGCSGYEGGGAIFNQGDLTLNNSILRDNHGEYKGGGIHNTGEMRIIRSAVLGNHVNLGGGAGIFNEGNMEITNTTIAENYSWHSGGYCAGIVNYGFLRINNSTISKNNNSDGLGGGLCNLDGEIHIKNTIIAGNVANPANDCFGEITSEGNNLIGDTRDCTLATLSSDLQNVDPLLIPVDVLQSGYYPVYPCSPAIDRGASTGCTDGHGIALTTDQRGQNRPVDGNGDGIIRCDIGAIEFQPEYDPGRCIYCGLINFAPSIDLVNSLPQVP